MASIASAGAARVSRRMGLPQWLRGSVSGAPLLARCGHALGTAVCRVRRRGSGYRVAMKPQAWALITFAALAAPMAWRGARRSKLALAIALMATTVAGLGLAFGALGYGGCARRGDCGTVGGALRTILVVAIILLAVLLLLALARALWRRVVPRRAHSGRRRARGDAPRMRRRDIALASSGSVMALSSIAVIASNRAEDRPGGLAVVLLSAGILCVPIAGRLATRNRLKPRLDRIEHDGALQPALVLPGSRVKLA